MNVRRVAAVIVNFNGPADCVACVASLDLDVQEYRARVIVVDNGSTDSSLLYIRQWFIHQNRPFFELGEEELSGTVKLGELDWPYALLRASGNRGYAAGSNLGIRLSMKIPGTEFIFVLNNDTLVAPGSISNLLEWAERHCRAGIIGSTLIEGNGQRQIAGGSRFNAISTRITPAVVSRRQGIDYVAGAAQFIRAEVLRRVGLLSEDYFLYFEELDLTHRMRAAGFSICWCPKSVVHHKVGTVAGSRSTNRKGKSELSEYHSNLSCLIFMSKFYPHLVWLAAPLRLVLKMIHDLMRGEISLVPALLRAYRDYIRHIAKGLA